MARPPDAATPAAHVPYGRASAVAAPEAPEPSRSRTVPGTPDAPTPLMALMALMAPHGPRRPLSTARPADCQWQPLAFPAVEIGRPWPTWERGMP